MQLTPVAESVRVARQFVGSCLNGWGTSAQRETAALLTSELVTNAVLHTAPHAVGSELTLIVGREDHQARIEVHDHHRALPVRREGTLRSESGRGIALVSAMASGWGATPTTAGKVVWFELGR